MAGFADSGHLLIPAGCGAHAAELPFDPEEWSLAHVAQWLRQMGLAKYAEKFEEQDIRGDVLLDLASEECELNLGIKVRGHRKLLLKSLEFLRRQAKHDPNMMTRY